MSTSTTERPGQHTADRAARLRLPALVAAGGVAGLAYIASVDPYTPGGYPLCPISALTGFACPGCGTLRCLHSLLNGDIAAAFARNPIVPILFVVGVLAFARWVVLRWRGEPFRWNPPNWVPISLGIGVLVFGVLRNVPGFEFLGP